MSMLVPIRPDLVPTEAAIDAVVQGMGKYLAVLLSSRPWQPVGTNVPNASSDRSQSACTRCQAPSHGHRLCVQCRRRSPTHMQGPALIQTMFELSHDRLAFTPERIKCFQQLEHAYANFKTYHDLNKVLENIALMVMRDTPPSEIGDVPIPENICSFHKTYTSLIEFWSARRYVCGAVGIALRDEIETRVKKWLLEVDRRVCDCYDLSRTIDADNAFDTRLLSHFMAIVDHFAYLIADHVALTNLEVAVEETGSHQVLGPAVCEAFCTEQLERVRDKAMAEHQRDVRAMDDLFSLVTEGMDIVTSLMTDVARRGAMASVLAAPPHEWTATMATVGTKPEEFAILKRAMTHPGLEDHVRVAIVETWRGDSDETAFKHVRTSLWLALEQLRKWSFAEQTGTSTGLLVIRRVNASETCDPGQLLPRLTWCATASRWALYSPLHHHRRRTGLDDIGYRSMYLSSVVWTMLGVEKPSEFQPGRVDAKLVRELACVEGQRASACLMGLETEMAPYKMAKTWHRTKKTVLELPEHMQDDLREAACAISRFSEVELVTCCHPATPLFRRTEGKLVRAVREHMFKSVFDEPYYVDFVRTAMELSLPLIRTQRISVGTLPHLRRHPLADRLFAVREVREWQPTAGKDLVLSPTMLKLHPVLRASLDACVAQRVLVRVHRRCYRFSSADLLCLMSAFV